MHIVKIDEIHLNAPILVRFKECGYNSRATINGAGTAIIYGCNPQNSSTFEKFLLLVRYFGSDHISLHILYEMRSDAEYGTV